MMLDHIVVNASIEMATTRKMEKVLLILSLTSHFRTAN